MVFQFNLSQIMYLIWLIFSVISVACIFKFLIGQSNSIYNKRNILEPVFKVRLAYSERLNINDYRPFHKYEIWRFYRFSEMMIRAVVINKF